MYVWIILCAALFGVSHAVAKTWFVSPIHGDDAQNGSVSAPWKSFEPVNKLILQPGDVIRITEPGMLKGSLAPQGCGSSEAPIRVIFAPGDYEWEHNSLLQQKLAISNTQDAPFEPKAIAIALMNVRHLQIEGSGATLYARGKQVHLYLNHAEDIVIAGLGFDYRRPTVSEYTALQVGGTEALIQIHPDSRYRIEGNRIVWVYDDGETNRTGEYLQRYDPMTGDVLRIGNNPAIDRNATTIERIGTHLLKITYSKNPGFKPGITYQHRLIRRDCAGVFCEESARITYQNVRFHFLHGMGVVSQFSRDLTFDGVDLAPRKESGRTCSAWADMLHFSGCAGALTIRNTHFSGSNDDAINVHGTHLRLEKACSPTQVIVRFMHHQTWGFKAFHAGDEVAFISRETLLPYATATLTQATLSTDGKTMTLDFAEPLPEHVRYGSDVLENITWTPSVTISDCVVENIPTRGFLLTTRRPILVERVQFNRTGMSALLIADDAGSWFESGQVTNMTVRSCVFSDCAEPVINVHPENRIVRENMPVHTHLTFTDNDFYLRNGQAFAFKSCAHITLLRNLLRGAKRLDDVLRTRACSDLRIEDNCLL